MALTVADLARVCHETNRAYQQVTADPAPSPSWEDAPDWQRDSAVEGVQRALDGETPEELHESWCEAKRRDGWVHGSTKDADAKTHPCLVDYDALPLDQRAKDHLFRGVVDALAPLLG